MNNNYQRMTVWFTKGQLQFIKKVAKKRKISGSELLRNMITTYKIPEVDYSKGGY